MFWMGVGVGFIVAALIVAGIVLIFKKIYTGPQ